MSEKTSWFRRILGMKDRNVILICVGIAIVFWLTNALSENYTHDYTFTLNYQLQENVSFTSPPREKINARISGRGWQLLQMSFKRRFRYLPVQVVRSEITRSDLIAAIYEHLSGYDVVVREVNVDVMTLDINIIMSREIAVVCKQVAIAADGYVLIDSLHPEPAVVTATGPAPLIERLQSIEVNTVELEPVGEGGLHQLDRPSAPRNRIREDRTGRS